TRPVRPTALTETPFTAATRSSVASPLTDAAPAKRRAAPSAEPPAPRRDEARAKRGDAPAPRRGEAAALRAALERLAGDPALRGAAGEAS
ncbi:MAG: hypothetical protein AAF192_21290, partial [Pseudomonadota bacterium]